MRNILKGTFIWLVTVAVFATFDLCLLMFYYDKAQIAIEKISHFGFWQVFVAPFITPWESYVSCIGAILMAYLTYKGLKARFK